MKDDIVGKFANLNTDAYDKYGVSMADTVVIAGSGFAPIDDDDNYKLLFVVSRLKEGQPENHGITVARKHLSILPDDVCKQLQEQLEQAHTDDQKEAPPESKLH